jgi:hypothetical protein
MLTVKKDTDVARADIVGLFESLDGNPPVTGAS